MNYGSLSRTSGSLSLMQLGKFQYYGQLADLEIWSRALTAREVQQVMNTQLTLQDGLGDACDACPSNRDRTCAPPPCLDRDGDGYGVQGASACGPGLTTLFDCSDNDPAIRPGAVEVGGGVDNNCDGQVDEGCVRSPQRTAYTYNSISSPPPAHP
jgi:hypothetical protein